MAKQKTESKLKWPRTGTDCAAKYFAASANDMRFFHFVIDTVLVGDWVAYVAKRALDGIDGTSEEDKKLDMVELAKTNPGPRTKTLRKQSQVLLEMFVARSVDNFANYLVDLIRAVLQKQPSILKSRQQSLTLEDIL